MQKSLQPAGELSADQIATLAKAGVIPKDTPPDVLAVFAIAAQQHGLSPFKREIYLVKYGQVYNTIVGIDGTRAKASRTGQYAGADDVRFNVRQDGTALTIADLKAAGKSTPDTCTITVYRIISGVRCPFTKTVAFSEFASGSNQKWRDMPFQMIAKVAESFALKMAFGDQLSGLHIEEEAAAFEGTTVDAVQYKTADPMAIEPELEDKKEDVTDSLTGCADLPAVLSYYKTFSESELGRHKGFILLFIKRGCQVSNNADDLGLLYKTLGDWMKNPILKAPLTERKKALENATPV